jgi:hypothetical protein
VQWRFELKFNSCPSCLSWPRCLHPLTCFLRLPRPFRPPSTAPLWRPVSLLPSALPPNRSYDAFFGSFLHLSLYAEPVPPSPPALRSCFAAPVLPQPLRCHLPPQPRAFSPTQPLCFFPRHTFGLTLMRLHVPSFRGSATSSSCRPCKATNSLLSALYPLMCLLLCTAVLCETTHCLKINCGQPID